MTEIDIKVEKNGIYNMDCIEGMKEIPDKSIDLVIADPPYNLSKGNDMSWDNDKDLEGFGGEWNQTDEDWDEMSVEDYVNFTFTWLSEVKRILKDGGSVWTFGTYHNIGILNVIYQKLDIEILNEVIWFKRNAFPNLSGSRFTASHENLLWGHKGDDYTFNYEEIKNMDFPEDDINDGGKQVRSVWDIPNNKTGGELDYGKHPTQKPLRVIYRIIYSSSNEGDKVLDPFIGSGTTAVACKQLGRDYIGFEINKEYYDIAMKRIKNTEKGLNGTYSGGGVSKWDGNELIPIDKLSEVCGIGKKTMEDIRKRQDHLTIDQLLNVSGIGEKTAERIYEKFCEDKDSKGEWVDVDDVELSPNYKIKIEGGKVDSIEDVYGRDNMLKTENNGYLLFDEVEGVKIDE